MANKNCAICVYNDGIRADSTYKCCSPERQRNAEITDCCIPEKPLRDRQRLTKDVVDFAAVTGNYIYAEKQKSLYWMTEARKLERTQI